MAGNICQAPPPEDLAVPVLRRDLLLVPPHGVVPRAAPTRRAPLLLGAATAACANTCR